MDAKSWPGAAKKDAGASRPAAATADASARWTRAGRLLRRSQFDAVYRGGQRRTSRHFAVFFRSNGGDRSRFGVSLKRQLGGAVVRNRIRRRLREILRLRRKEIPTGWDIVIHPRSEVATVTFARLSDELIELLRRALRTPPPKPPAE